MKTIGRITTAVLAVALAMALHSSQAQAQTQVPTRIIVSGASGHLSSGTCPKGTGTCFLETVTGTVQKSIGGIPSGGSITLTLNSETDNAIAAPVSGDCFPTQGSGSITSKSGRSVLSFDVQGLECNTQSGLTCLTGPLNFAITPGSGNFATASGAGTFSAESLSCLASADVQITMQGVILK